VAGRALILGVTRQTPRYLHQCQKSPAAVRFAAAQHFIQVAVNLLLMTRFVEAISQVKRFPFYLLFG
jgi:hypothetical protein